MERKICRGRQKIKMEKIQNQNSLQPAFSKRRASMMNKANELSTLTGADVGLVIFSPGNRVFSFFSPSVESVLERFKNSTEKRLPCTPIEKIEQVIRKDDQLEKIYKRIMLLEEQCEAEKTCGNDMKKMKKLEECLGEVKIEDLSLDQLTQYKEAFNELARIQMNYIRKKVSLNADQLENPQGGTSTFGDGFQLTREEASSSSNGVIDQNFPPAPEY